MLESLRQSTLISKGFLLEDRAEGCMQTSKWSISLSQDIETLAGKFSFLMTKLTLGFYSVFTDFNKLKFRHIWILQLG